MSHTPGPWSLLTDRIGPQNKFFLRRFLAPTGEVIGKAYTTTCGDAVDAANAALISAAPDMLAALVNAADWIARTRQDFGLEDDGTLLEINEAIAKARP